MLQSLLLTILTTILLFVLPEYGFATETVISGALCNAIGWIHGRTGMAIAVLAMAITGALLLFNKITWNIAIIHLVGEAVMFKASAMVSAIADGGVDC